MSEPRASTIHQRSRLSNRRPPQKAEPKGSPSSPKPAPSKVEKSKGGRAQQRKAEAIPLVPMAPPLLGPKVDLPALAAPADLGARWNDAQKWVGSAVKGAILPGSHETGGGEPAENNTEDETAKAENVSSTYDARRKFPNAVKELSQVKPATDESHFLSEVIPRVFQGTNGARFSPKDIYAKYQLARRHVFNAHIPEYFTKTRGTISPERLLQEEKNAVDYFVSQMGPLSLVSSEEVSPPLDVHALIAEMNRLTTPQQRQKAEIGARSYTAALNQVIPPKHKGDRIKGERLAGSIEWAFHGDRKLPWDTLNDAVMQLVLRTPPRHLVSFHALDENIRRALNIQSDDDIVFMKSTNRALPWKMRYRDLFDYVIKNNAKYVVDYPRIRLDTILKWELHPKIKNPMKTSDLVPVTLEELVTPRSA